MVRLFFGRMYSFIILLFLIFVAWLYSPSVRADQTFTFIIKKQEEKAKTRWSLSEWLDTRDRMRLMDLWLALHSPSPYEFFVGASYVHTAPEGGARASSLRYSGAAYASIFGLGGEYEKTGNWNAQFLIRLFGHHAQGTNLTLHAGVRGLEPGKRGAIGGAAMNIYLARHFGLAGLYRHHFRSIPNDSGVRAGGFRAEGGAFIDFSFLRVFGDYFSETQNLTVGESQKSVRNGFQLGAKLFF